MEQFTASEVRELAATIWPDLSGREEVAETLNAYADLLEAREREDSRSLNLNAIVSATRGALAAHSAQAQPSADQFDPERNVRPGDVGTEPPAVSVPGELAEPSTGVLNYEQELSFAEGWNACRKAMLAARENPNG